MTSPHFIRAALELAARGWRVFPCKPGRKEPATRHGCLDATTDVDRIRRWWRATPMANVAIATGTPGPDVVDVDIKDGRAGLAAMERLRLAGLLAGPNVLVQTPSGGLHLYFAGSDQSNGKLARHGLDFRSRGGYVLAPPSVIDGTPYQLLEQRNAGRGVDWSRIKRFLDPPRPMRPPPGVRPTGGLDGLARWVADQTEGNRNDGLFWAACRAVEDGHNDLDVLVTAACAAGLTEHEARRTVTSALGRCRSHG